MGKKALVLLLALCMALGLVAGCASPAAQQKPAETAAPAGNEATATPDARAKLLIGVADLQADLAKYTILDTRDPKAYAAGHVEGAISAPWQTFATVAKGKPGDPNWGTLLPAADIAAALGKLGVDPSKTTVIYSDPTGWGEDGRVAWTMQSIGLDNVMLLDGGYPAWTAAGGPTSTKATTLAATTVSVVSDNLTDVNVTTEEVKAAVESSGAIILDVRTKKEFDGAKDFGEARGGHLPGAVNIPFAENFNEDGTVKSDADLLALYNAAGISADSTVYAYCTKGIRSAYVYEMLQMIGVKQARNWDASFYSWAGDSALPLDK